MQGSVVQATTRRVPPFSRGTPRTNQTNSAQCWWFDTTTASYRRVPCTQSSRNMEPQAEHAPQQKCTGLFIWENGSIVNATCYGVSKPLFDAYVDLLEHAEGRPKPSHHSILHNLSCLGAAVYQNQVDPQTGVIPPPACLGIEFQRYKQLMHSSAAMQSQSGLHAANDHTALQHNQHLPVGQDLELLHSEHQPHASDSSTSGPADGYVHLTDTHAPQVSTSSSTAGAIDGLKQPDSAGVIERLQQLHAEVSERLEGQDPLWFGKAFAARASVNWDSMKSMSAQMVESVKADLGLAPKSEDSK